MVWVIEKDLLKACCYFIPNSPRRPPCRCVAGGTANAALFSLLLTMGSCEEQGTSLLFCGSLCSEMVRSLVTGSDGPAFRALDFRELLHCFA